MGRKDSRGPVVVLSNEVLNVNYEMGQVSVSRGVLCALLALIFPQS